VTENQAVKVMLKYSKYLLTNGFDIGHGITFEKITIGIRVNQAPQYSEASILNGIQIRKLEIEQLLLIYCNILI
jgi:hypothetical protein